MNTSPVPVPCCPPEQTGRYLCGLLDTDFTEEQLAVICHPLRPQLVVAGAGSGKTTVLAARVVHAVAFHRVPPGQVLGLTFTNKAASQLADQVRAALARLDPPESGGADRSCTEDGDPFDEDPTIATYHSYAAGLLADHALRVGREPHTKLLTEASRWQLAMRVVASADGPFPHLRWQPTTVARYLLDLDGELAEHLRTVADVRACNAAIVEEITGLTTTTVGLRDCAEAARARDELLTLVVDYRSRKQLLDRLDYGDQVALAAEIAGACRDVCELERARYRLVLLDEYQDTGVAQRLLLAALFGAGHPVTAVGDPNQAIYGWRGASVGNLLRFATHFPDGAGPRPQPLMTSFRCGGRILAVADELAAPLRSSPAALRRPALDVPPLASTRQRMDDGATVVACLSTVEQEAAWVADQLAGAVHHDAVAPGEIAVLCRRRADFPLLYDALVGAGLPVEVIGLGGLLSMPEIADVAATLRVLVEPTANAALVRLLTGPRWRIGPRDLAALGKRALQLAGQADRTDEDGGVAALRAAAAGVDPTEVAALLDAVDSPGSVTAYSPAAVERLGTLRAELVALRRVVGLPVVEVVSEVVSRTGLDVEIEAAPEPVAIARAANLAAFADQAAHFTGLDGTSDLASFLAYLDAAAEAEDGLDVGGVSSADTVKLLTVHKAKGLEWQVVAIPGLTQGVFPHTQSRSRWLTAAKVLPYRLRGDAADLPRDPAWTGAGLQAFARACRDDDADEERRLGYVAVTRAKHRLLLSGYWWGATQKRPKGPSALLEEAAGLAERGLVRRDVWVDEPGEANPHAAGSTLDVAWPVPPDTRRASRLGTAADLVRTARSGQLPEPAALSLAEAEIVASWRTEAAALRVELSGSHTGVCEVALPLRLTTSQLMLLAREPATLARTLGRPMPTRPVPQARLGSRFHAWVQARYDVRPLFEPDDLPGAGDAEAGDLELAALQHGFLASPYAERAPVAVEAPFELVVAGRCVRGRIDAVYANADGFEVIDWKTGRAPADPVQLAVYRLAWAGLAGVAVESVSAAFLYVATGRVVHPPLLTEDELATLLSGTG